MNRRILLWLVAAALAFRLGVFLWELLFPLQFNAVLQNFADFKVFYLWQFLQLSHGYLPYRDFAYSYPPLFIYTLYPFYLLSANAAALPIVLADALTAVLIYLTVKLSASKRIALVASLAYVFSPFALTYEGFSWLSEQPMLFFLLLSIYSLKKNDWKLSAVSYGVAVMFKQDAVFFLPAYIFWALKQFGVGRGLKNLALFATVVLVISAPFLIFTFNGYMETMTFGQFGGLFPFSPPLLPPAPGPPLSGLGVATIGSLSVYQLGCTVATNNLFGVSNICLVLWNGLTVTNGVTILPSNFVLDVLSAFALLLLIPLIAEVFLLHPQKRLVFSFALSGALLLVPVLLFSELPNYKYYFVPFYALMLASSTDGVTTAIASAFPIIALLNPFGYFNELLPIVEMQFMIIYWVLRKRGGE